MRTYNNILYGTKMKFTDDQKELLALLPQELKNSQELTDSARLVLSNIIFLYGMEDAQKNGYVYRSYDDLMKDTLIKSKTSISKAIALLLQKEFIKVTRETFIPSLENEGIVGSISELYDSKKPQLPKGALAQAWSVAEVFRIILEK